VPSGMIGSPAADLASQVSSSANGSATTLPSGFSLVNRLLCLESLDCLVFRIVDFEYRVHADKHERRMDRRQQPAQLQVPARSVHLSQARQDGTEAGAVDKLQLAHVEHHLGTCLEHRRDVAFEL